MARRAIIGFEGIALMPLKENTITKYESAGSIIHIPHAGTMTRTPKETSQDFYYDNRIYAALKEVLGDEVEIRIAELELSLAESLGLGEYDSVTGALEADFAVQNKQYSLRCITDTVDKFPFYWNYRVFDLSSIKFDNFATKGSNIAICEAIITGSFSAPGLRSVKPYRAMQLLEDKSNLTACEAMLADGEVFP